MSRRLKQYLKVDFKADHTAKVTCKGISGGQSVIAAAAIMSNVVDMLKDPTPDELAQFRVNTLALIDFTMANGRMPTDQEIESGKVLGVYLQSLSGFCEGYHEAAKEVPTNAVNIPS